MRTDRKKTIANKSPQRLNLRHKERMREKES